MLPWFLNQGQGNDENISFESCDGNCFLKKEPFIGNFACLYIIKFWLATFENATAYSFKSL